MCVHVRTHMCTSNMFKGQGTTCKNLSQARSGIFCMLQGRVVPVCVGYLLAEKLWMSAQNLQAESLGLHISSAALTQCDPGQVPHRLQTSLCVERNSRIYSLGSHEDP